MASFRKTDTGYQATIYVGRDSEGKHIRKYVTKPTLKEAKYAALVLEQEIAEGNATNIPRMSLEQYLDKWFEVNKAELKPSTQISYKMYIERHFKPALGKYLIEELTELKLKEFFSEKKKNLNTNTVRKIFFMLRRALRDALKHKSPLANMKPPKTASPKENYVYSTEEFSALHEAVRGTSDEVIILLAAWVGLRLGEIFALRCSDFDPVAETIKVDEARTVSDEGYIISTPKSERGVREILLPDRLVELFKKMDMPEDDGLLFPMRPDSYSKRFRKILTTCGFPLTRFHDLRHYHASQLYKHKVDDHVAANRLGHDIHILKGIYQHMEDLAIQKNNKRIKEIFK